MIIVAFFIVQATFAQTGRTGFYVSPLGNDNNLGTIGKPFHTIEKAKEAVRFALSKNPTQHVTVYLREGDHFPDSTIVFNTEDSGTDEFPVYYRAYKKEIPIINGGKRIKIGNC